MEIWSTVMPPLFSCASTGLVVFAYGASSRAVRRRTLVILCAGSMVHLVLLLSLRPDSLFVPTTVGMFYISNLVGPPALS